MKTLTEPTSTKEPLFPHIAGTYTDDRALILAALSQIGQTIAELLAKLPASVNHACLMDHLGEMVRSGSACQEWSAERGNYWRLNNA